MFARPILMSVLACAIAGCALPNAKAGKAGALGKEGVVGKSKIAGSKGTGGSFGTVFDPDAGHVTATSGNLVGTVRVPASIISNNGGGIVSNNGGGIISNNGGGIISNAGSSYRVLALSQPIVKGATVTLLDAAGNPVKGRDGKPLTAVTSVLGTYEFRAELPVQNLIVSVDLGTQGQILALAPKAGAAKHEVNLDLISTFTTRYILNQYVKGQPDPVATLERLPADVEADTRAKAADGFAKAGEPVPESLAADKVVAAVDTIRSSDKTFDAQMETVKKLLIFAGQSDLGNGKKGTEVGLGNIRALTAQPDGSLLINCYLDSRVWRLGADGVLTVAAGSGNPSSTPLSGQAGPDAGLNYPISLAFDAQKRLLVLDYPYNPTNRALPNLYRVSRLGADGKFADVWTDAKPSLAAWPGSGDEALLLVWANTAAGPTLELDGVTAGQAPVAKKTYTADEAALLNPSPRDKHVGWYGPSTVCGRDANGALYVGVPGDLPAVYKLDPAGFALSEVKKADGTTVESVSLDAAGNVFAVTLSGGARSLVVFKPDGTSTTLIASLTPDFVLLPEAGVALMPNGDAYVVRRENQVYKIANGQATLVAGKVETSTGDASDVSIAYPSGMVQNATGDIFLSDKFSHKVLKIGKDRQVTVAIGTGEGGKNTGDGGPATQAAISQPRAVRMDAAGNLYALSSGLKVRKVDTNGIISTAYTAPASQYIRDLVIAPDGSATMSLKGNSNTDGNTSVVRLKPDGTTTTIEPSTPAPGSEDGFILGADPAGKLYIIASSGAKRQLFSWTEADGLKLIKEDPRFNVSFPNDSNGLAVDAKGRVFFTLIDQDQVMMYDPAGDKFTVEAGLSGSHFNGKGIDNSLNGPRYPMVDKDGNLLFSDSRHRQIKRIPANEL